MARTLAKGISLGHEFAKTDGGRSSFRFGSLRLVTAPQKLRRAGGLLIDVAGYGIILLRELNDFVLRDEVGSSRAAGSEFHSSKYRLVIDTSVEKEDHLSRIAQLDQRTGTRRKRTCGPQGGSPRLIDAVEKVPNYSATNFPPRRKQNARRLFVNMSRPFPRPPVSPKGHQWPTAATGHRDPEPPVGRSSLRLSPEFLSVDRAAPDLCCFLHKLFLFRWATVNPLTSGSRAPQELLQFDPIVQRHLPLLAPCQKASLLLVCVRLGNPEGAPWSISIR